MDECVHGQMDGRVHAMYGRMYGLTNVNTCAYPLMWSWGHRKYFEAHTDTPNPQVLKQELTLHRFGVKKQSRKSVPPPTNSRKTPRNKLEKSYAYTPRADAVVELALMRVHICLNSGGRGGDRVHTWGLSERRERNIVFIFGSK